MNSFFIFTILSITSLVFTTNPTNSASKITTTHASSKVSSAQQSRLCQAESARNNLILKLTPSGQNATWQMLRDVQVTSGILMQPIMHLIFEAYETQIKQILSSTDSSRLNQLGSLLGFHNASCGFGPVQNMCSLQANLTSLVSSLSTEHRQTVEKIVNSLVYELKAFNATILGIVKYFDTNLIVNLSKNENSTLLNEIFHYSFIWNYF
jgi:hypothetical protein